MANGDGPNQQQPPNVDPNLAETLKQMGGAVAAMDEHLAKSEEFLRKIAEHSGAVTKNLDPHKLAHIVALFDDFEKKIEEIASYAKKFQRGLIDVKSTKEAKEHILAIVEAQRPPSPPPRARARRRRPSRRTWRGLRRSRASSATTCAS